MLYDPIINWPDQIPHKGLKYDAVLDVKFEDEGDEPVTLAEAKVQCAIDGTAFDTLLTTIIAKARRIVENKYNCSLKTRSIEAVLYAGTPLPYTTGNEWDLTSIEDEDGKSLQGEWKDVTSGKYTVSYDIEDVTNAVAEYKLDVLQKVYDLYINVNGK